jgi:formate dehydrogenase subunit gamma
VRPFRTAGFAAEQNLRSRRINMAKIFAVMRLFAGALALAFVVATAIPASAQQPNSVNPTAAAVKEQQLLQHLKVIQGRGSIPDVKSQVIEHPAGRDWREYRMVTLQWIGGVVIIGVLIGLVIFYLARGSIRIERGRSGIKIVRFNAFERFIHWMTASCFVVMALTGLNITFGRALLLPLLGPEAFSTFSEWGKYAHNFLSFPFTIGVIVIFVIWITGNIPNKVDVDWVKRGGGIVGHDHPPAYRFNAGQKGIFWIQMLGGTAMVITGFLLLFPFYGTTVGDMQLAEVAHSVVAMLYIAAILGHIYIGTLGMEGAFEAMGSGTVDLNWAKEHHSLWLEQEKARIGANESQPQPMGAPAE